MVHSLGYTLIKRSGAGDGDRTRDTKLGKLVLYQLSYTRSINDPYGLFLPFCQPVLAEVQGFLVLLPIIKNFR